MTTHRLVLEAPETGELVVEGREFAVRIGADLDVEVMAQILLLHQEFRRYGMNKPERIADWITRAKTLIFEIVESQSPAPEDMEFLRHRAMSPSEAFQILTLLSGNPGGPEAEVAAALSDGVEPGAEGEGLVDPTTSRPRSRGRSSRSARRSSSALPTGEDSGGATSGSISDMSTAA